MQIYTHFLNFPKVSGKVLFKSKYKTAENCAGFYRPGASIVPFLEVKFQLYPLVDVLGLLSRGALGDREAQ